MSKHEYWSPSKILDTGADYMVVYGQRSNGKTTGVEGYSITDYISSGYKNQLAIIRRWEEDYKGKNGTQMFDAINTNGWIDDKGKHHTIKQDTKGMYNMILYYSQRWYFAKIDDNGKIEYKSEDPFAIGFSITSEEHYKSTSYPNITNILFDEFITRSYYLPDEFVKFQNLLSTIIRLRNNVKIFMLGNTINKYCPYFTEMGLTNIKKQEPNTIDIYSYGDSDLKVAVEYSDFKGKKESNKYFAFNNPKLQMITNGNWEMSIYPHLPVKYIKSEIKYIYFINFDEELLQCEIITSKQNHTTFTFIHRKTTPIKEDNVNIVYQREVDERKNYRRKITKPYDKIGEKIYYFYKTDKVFYQDNEVGEIVRNYIMWCKKESE